MLDAIIYLYSKYLKKSILGQKYHITNILKNPRPRTKLRYLTASEV